MTGVWEIWDQMHIVEHLWQMSLLAGLLIGFVLILRLLLRKCSKGYSYGLWLLVLLRLLCPIFIESDYSMQPLFLTDKAAGVLGNNQLQLPSAQVPRSTDGLYDKEEDSLWTEAGGNANAPGQMGMSENGSGPNGNYAAFPSGNDMNGQSAFFKENGQNHLASLGKAADGMHAGRNVLASAWERGWLRCLAWLQGIYVLGAGGLMVYFAVLYMGWKRKLADAVHIRANIWYSEKVASPFVLGVLRPRIYLPFGLRAEEESHILLHEESHIRHMDPLLRLMGTFALCLHWWNPLVWLGIHLFYQDMEMFCDETAMARADLSDRQAYSATLLHFAIRKSGPATMLAFGETHTERRIRNVLEQKRRGRGITLLVALAAAAGGFIFLTVPQATQAGMLEKDPVSNNIGQADGGQQGQQEKLQNFVLSEGQVETSVGNAVTLQLVLVEGTYTSYQVPGSTAAENYEGIYELRTLDAQGQLLDKVELVNEQGGNTVSFAYRDFPWYFEDYNLDGKLDFFVGTKAADGRSYHYLFTVTAEGGLEHLFDGPMWESYIPMTAQDITYMGLESGGEEHDFREMLLYQANEEYSSHDFYNWSPYLEKYRKCVEFTGVYPEGWNQDAADYLEGEWRISGIDMWNQDLPRPDERIGEILNYTGGAFQQLDAEGNVVYENNMAGCSSLVQSSEEFWDTFNMAWFTPDAENARRILVNLGEECRLGNVIYVLDDNSMLVYDLRGGGAFWTATRVELRGEAAEVQQYLQG